MKRNNLFIVSIIVAIIALVTTACQLSFMPSLIGGTETREPPQKEADEPNGDGEREEAPERDITPTEEEFEWVDMGSATLENIISTGDGFTAGEIIKVKVHNPSDKPTTVEIPCGLIFNPPKDSGEQKLMVIQAVVEEIPAGGTAELTPYVVCIESSASVPGEGSAYVFGDMATEAGLVKLSECLCREDLDPSMAAFQEMLGIQFATWMVAGGMDMDELDGSQGGAMGELMESFGDLMEMFTEPAQEWLDKCDIEIEK